MSTQRLEDTVTSLFSGLDLSKCFRCRQALPPTDAPADMPRWCDACQETARAEQEVEQTRRQELDAYAALQRMNLPKAYAWATFDSQDLAARVARPDAIEGARKACGDRRVLLVGEAGSGKTSLACAMLRQRGRGLFAGAYYIAKARSEHRLGEGEAPEIDRAIAAPLLVLDDLGLEQAKNTAISEVIYERHAEEKATIVTTGFGFKALVDVLEKPQCVRRWGTTRGLGEIALGGPTAKTVLVPHGKRVRIVRSHILTSSPRRVLDPRPPAS